MGELESHKASCPAKPLLCQWCQEMVAQNKTEVSMPVLIPMLVCMFVVTVFNCPNDHCLIPMTGAFEAVLSESEGFLHGRVHMWCPTAK